MPFSRVCKRKAHGLEVSATLTDDNFLKPPDPSQRNWSVVRTLEEATEDLVHLDRVSKRFVDGSKRSAITEQWAKSQAKYDDQQLIIDGQQVMQEWERPYMEAMADVVTETHGDVLEIGFGMGISASYILAKGVKSYTVIEANEEVKTKFDAWATKYPGQNVRLVLGKWQDAIGALAQYDGIFFDTYPLSEDEFQKFVVEDSTFAEHFFAAAAEHLRPGGIFTYYSNEIDSVSRRHQRALFKHFKSITFSVCTPLFPPNDCNYWWADSMIVTKCVK
ncbi:MAG TPA: class I SAM-dependent methyltransferase [Kofleriaceae bacterium]|jgi:guanidinoacetate N-methyltransferase